MINNPLIKHICIRGEDDVGLPANKAGNYGSYEKIFPLNLAFALYLKTKDTKYIEVINSLNYEMAEIQRNIEINKLEKYNANNTYYSLVDALTWSPRR